MPAVSKKQRRFMGVVKAAKEGKPVPGASAAIKRAVKAMSMKQVNEFASTKEKGLPVWRNKKRNNKRSKGAI